MHVVGLLYSSLSKLTGLNLFPVNQKSAKVIFFSGNVKYTVAQQLYNDLLEARDRLSVNTYLHLIHLVIPYESVETVKINPNVFQKAVSMACILFV